MTQHTALAGGRSSFRAVSLLAGAVASGAVAIAAGLGSAPTAHASCVSAFGLGKSADCTSSLTGVAIAIGTGAQAHADGLFGGAFSVGNGAFAGTDSAFDFATVAGNNAEAFAGGLFGIATQLGPNGYTQTVGSGSFGNIGANIAISVSPATTGFRYTTAGGIGNIAVNLFDNTTTLQAVSAIGTVNVAANFRGSNSLVFAGSQVTPATGSMAFNAFGKFNEVDAGPGPLAVAGSIGQTGATVVKEKPGFNINGVKVPNTAAAGGGTKTSAPAAAAARNGKKTASPGAASSHSKR